MKCLSGKDRCLIHLLFIFRPIEAFLLSLNFFIPAIFLKTAILCPYFAHFWAIILLFVHFPNKLTMFKNYTFVMLGLLLASTAIAQNETGRWLAQVSHPLPKLVERPFYAFETSVPEIADPHPLVNYRNEEEVAGLTRWDAQWYGCGSRRVYANAAGEPVASWLFSLQPSGFTDRGTGYNVRNGGTWPAVNQRVEAVRTGFPSATILGDGTEIIISHNTSVTPFKLWMARKAPGATTWTESALPNPPGIRMLWPKIAVGGPDHQTLHVIGITAPVGGATFGTVYQGLNGHILYYRSTDGGLTWDQQNVVIPGLDSSRYVGFGADSYTIDASGNGAVIAVFPSWNDVRVYKSVDNGDSWSDLQVLDFPDAVENYDPQPGAMYTVDDIPLDTLAPEPLAIRTHDGFGAVLMDENQEVHAWFGRMYVTDLDNTDTLSSYYPTTNGLYYWKESFEANNPQIITGAFDYDGDGQLAIAALNELATYNGSNLSSFPTVGTDNDGNIYLVYAAINELYRTGSAPDQFYRHLYAMKSTDGGTTWGDALELTDEPYVIPDLAPFLECVYPAVPRHIGDQLWVLYQQDFLPGSMVLSTPMSPSGENSIMWVSVEKDSIAQALVGTFEAPQADPTFAMRLMPNPATTLARLVLQLAGTAPARVEVFDVLGRPVQRLELDTAAGQQGLDLDVQHLAAGMYWVRVMEGARFGVTKLVVER